LHVKSQHYSFPFVSDGTSDVNTVVGCSPSSLLDCAENTVSQECGEEIATVGRALGNTLLQEYGCDTRKRQLCCLFQHVYRL